MSRPDRPYSRVYWEAIDDTKFATVWDDDHALAAWLRLLVAADMAWPASPTLYHGIRRASLKVLCDAGLVDMQTGGRYRIHGLDKERDRRSTEARAAANIRHHGNAEGMRPHPETDAPALRAQPNGNAEGMPSQEEQSQEEPRRGKTRREEVPPYPPSDDDDHLDAWYRLTASWPSAKVLPWLNELAATHGPGRVSTALAEEWSADSDRKSLLSRTQTRLEAAAHAAGKARRKAEADQAAAERERIEAMPPEQRAENMARFRSQLVASGLMTPEKAEAYVNGRPE